MELYLGISLPNFIVVCHRATDALRWIENKSNFESIKAHFDSTSRFARLQRIHTRVAGRMLYIRWGGESCCRTVLFYWTLFVGIGCPGV